MTLFVFFACVDPAASNTPPEVSIASPKDGADFRSGEPFTIEGKIDDNDGPNSLDVTWTITPEPEESPNALRADDEVSLFLETGILEQGDYTASVTATDAWGAASTDEVAFTIEENQPPSVVMKEPNEGETYGFGDPLIVEVNVNPRDDDMSLITLTWGGAAEGAPDAPSQVPENGLVIFYVEDVSKGRQTVSVTATDGGGETDTDDVSFRVQ